MTRARHLFFAALVAVTLLQNRRVALGALTTMEGAGEVMAALPAPHVDIDALPYIDGEYNDPSMKAQVDALVEAEMRTFKPKDYLAKFPVYEPSFDDHPLLLAEWLRVSDGQPMPKMDTTRYQLNPPPDGQQNDLEAWQRAVENAQAQLEHQMTRLGNLELLQQYGANQWRAHLNGLDASTGHLARAHAELDEKIKLVNRKRKAEQEAAGPRLAALEADWVNAVKENLEIEAQCLQLEAECAAMQEAAEAAKRQAR